MMIWDYFYESNRKFLDMYLKYILRNRLQEHIDYLVDSKFINFMWFDYNCQLAKYLFNKACRYGTINMVEQLVYYADIDNIRNYVISSSYRSSTDIMEFVLNKFKEYLYEIYCEKRGFISKYAINYSKLLKIEPILISFIKENNMKYYRFFIDKITDIVDELSSHSVKPILKNSYKYHTNNLSYSTIQHSLLRFCVENDFPIFAEQLIQDGTEFTSNDICNRILNHNSIGILELFAEKQLLDVYDMDDMFENSYKCSVELVEILIDNGADYKTIGEEVLESALKNKNKPLAKYLKKLLAK